MINKTLTTFSCLLLLASFTLAGRETPENPASDDIIAPHTHQQVNEKTDSEILTSLDNLTLDLENELFEVEQGQNNNTLNAEAIAGWEQELSDLEQMSALDNFEQVQFPPLMTEQPIGEWLETAEPAETQGKSVEEFGVGIAGEQENLINSLDNSDLMDFEDNLDVWSDDLVEDQASDADNYY
ncbi:hypothetical protein [Thalassomonas actiniarum]|uniref:Uncharacterized protein n=1 Tax=Thalassomonas actiniarum TaxID=485447 RepID=A0AAE9YV46_9GAMM|nr:hypothetical protein [Thalassomonas actiniarum]WDE00212.1 hypothetical protein SG35_006045 [Thalassomonas actiniarum]